jgi:micrococcal nuclease
MINRKIVGTIVGLAGAAIAYLQSTKHSSPIVPVSLAATGLGVDEATVSNSNSLNSYSNSKSNANSTKGVASDTDVYLVMSCNDGDTCRVKSTDGQETKVRMVGIDAPEFAGKKKLGQPMAPESKDYINQLLKGKKVRLNSFGSDIYNRNLAEIYLGDKNINVEMVNQGFAEVYHGRPPKGLVFRRYEDAERAAKSAKRGVWSLEKYESPKDFRARMKRH